MTEDGLSPRRGGAAAADTRRALLEAGAELLREQPVGTVLSQIKALAVAQRAGRTTGAFFHHWDSQDAYHRDLVTYVLDPARIPSTADAVAALAAGLLDHVPFEVVLARAARDNFESVQADPYVPLWFALWAKHGQDDLLRDLLRTNYQEVSRGLVPLYAALLEAAGRVPKPPYTVEVIAVTLTALNQGLALRAAIEPEAAGLATDTSAAGEPAELFSALVVTVFTSMTVPAR